MTLPAAEPEPQPEPERLPEQAAESVSQWAQRWARACADKPGECDVCGVNLAKGMKLRGLKTHANGRSHQKALARSSGSETKNKPAKEKKPTKQGGSSGKGNRPKSASSVLEARCVTCPAQSKNLFSKSQLAKGRDMRCKLCVAEKNSTATHSAAAAAAAVPAVQTDAGLIRAERKRQVELKVAASAQPQRSGQPEPEPEPEREREPEPEPEPEPVLNRVLELQVKQALFIGASLHVGLPASAQTGRFKTKKAKKGKKGGSSGKDKPPEATSIEVSGRSRLPTTLPGFYGQSGSSSSLKASEKSLITDFVVSNTTVHARKRMKERGVKPSAVHQNKPGAGVKIRDGVVLTVVPPAWAAGAGQYSSMPDRKPKKGEHSETIDCPASALGAVIGKGGETAQKIRKQSGVRLLRAEDNPPRIELTGSEPAVRRARAMVEAVLSKYMEELSEELSETIDCPASALGAVIGKGGETAQKIRKQSGVRLLRAEDNPPRIELTGSEPAVRRARAMVEAVLSKYMEELSEELSETIDCPASALGAVIGKGGETAQKIRKQSGVRLLGAEDNPPRIELTGSEPAVRRARAMVEAVLRRLHSPEDGADLQSTSSEEDAQSDAGSETDDSEPEPELESEPERGTLEYMAREVITQLVLMRSAIIMDATVVSLAAVAVKGWEVERATLCDAVYNSLPDGWSVTGRGKHRKIKCVIGPVQADTQLTPAAQVNVKEAVAKINAPIKSMVQLRAFDALTTSHLLAEPRSQALKPHFSNISELVAIVSVFGREASGLRAVLLEQAGVAEFVQALRQSWVFANNRAKLELAFGAVADPSLGPTAKQIDLLLTPVTQRESISGVMAYTAGAFDKVIVAYRQGNGQLSVRFVPAVIDPLMEEAAAEARKEIARACACTCQISVEKDGTTLIRARLKMMNQNMLIKVASICKKHAPHAMIIMGKPKKEQTKEKTKENKGRI